jgi:hypothetical protein
MTFKTNYSIMEVEFQSEVKRVVYDDPCVEPQCELGLKDPGRFSMYNLVAQLSGKAALHQFKKGDLVAVELNFSRRQKDGEFVNQISVHDIKLVKELDPVWL